MKNSRAKSVLNDCRLELLKIRGLINSYGSMHTITGFLTQYALIKVSELLKFAIKQSLRITMIRFLLSCNVSFQNR